MSGVNIWGSGDGGSSATITQDDLNSRVSKSGDSMLWGTRYGQ